MTKSTIISLRFNDEMINFLRKQAKCENRTLSNMINNILLDYMIVKSEKKINNLMNDLIKDIDKLKK